MKDGKTCSKKAGIYALITLGVASIVLSACVIVGSIFIQSKITNGMNNIYASVEETYQKTDNTVTRAQEFVDVVKADFNKVAPLINILTDTEKKKFSDAIDTINAKIDDIQKFLDDAKNSVAQTNEKIEIVNSLGIASLPKLSGERVENASEKVNEFSNDLDVLKADISNNAAKQTVVDKVNTGIDDTQKALTAYRVKISDAKQNALDFKNLVIFWSTLGTIFIVGFFVWSIYSFYYFTRSQIQKLKNLKQ